MSFKKIHSLEKRKSESDRIKIKYPDKIPIIVEKYREGSNKDTLPMLDKHKYLSPGDITVGQFIFAIRKRMKLKSEQSLFMFIGDKLPPSSKLLSQAYKENSDEDGFLYCIVFGENSFGN
jgi:GABA(A) receptor-associated protein